MTPAPESPVATPRSWADAPLAPEPAFSFSSIVGSRKKFAQIFIVFSRELLQAMSEESQQRPPQSAHCFPCTQDSVSRCKREIQNIVFENADKIPDGVYKQLMDALLIKD
jgi:hypothetical protein